MRSLNLFFRVVGDVQRKCLSVISPTCVDVRCSVILPNTKREFVRSDDYLSSLTRYQQGVEKVRSWWMLLSVAHRQGKSASDDLME